jgi:hypothetical protein
VGFGFLVIGVDFGELKTCHAKDDAAVILFEETEGVQFGARLSPVFYLAAAPNQPECGI